MNGRMIDPVKLAGDHWNYVKTVINTAWESIGTDQSVTLEGDYYISFKSALELIGHHYKTAFVHGFKHGKEGLCKDE